MRAFSTVLCLASVALLAACSSTPDSRIAANQKAFDALPSEVQQKIRSGQVEVGFTPEMVRLAVGDPTRIYNRQTETGAVEVWSYHSNTPQISFGVGMGSYGSGGGGAVGVSTTTGGFDPDEKMRVEFRNARVTAVEHRRKG